MFTIWSVVFRLLENYVPTPGSLVLHEDIFRHYTESFKIDHFNPRTLGDIIKEVFPGVKIAHNGLQCHVVYKGISSNTDWESDRQFSNASDDEIFRFSNGLGYQGQRCGSTLVLYQKTSFVCNQHSVFKEVHLEGEHICVRIEPAACRKIKDNFLPTLCKTWNTLQFILNYVSNATMCKGIVSGVIPYLDLTQCDIETWELEDGKECKTIHYKSCLGVLDHQQYYKSCRNCKASHRQSLAELHRMSVCAREGIKRQEVHELRSSEGDAHIQIDDVATIQGVVFCQNTYLFLCAQNKSLVVEVLTKKHFLTNCLCCICKNRVL